MPDIPSPLPPPPQPVMVPAPVPQTAITNVAVPVSPNLPQLNPDGSGDQGANPQQQQAAAAAEAGAVALLDEAVTLSPNLQKLVSANLVNATVIARDAQNRIIVRTDMGSFIAADNNALRLNSRIQMQFNPLDPQKSLVIIVDDLPPATPLSLKLAPLATNLDPSARQAAGQTVTATVVAGTPLISGTAPETMLPTGSQLVVRVQPNPSAPPIPSLSRQITGTVLGQNDTGQVLLRTPLGTLALNTRLSVPMNAAINFQVVDLRAPPSPMPAEQAGALEQKLGRTWPALDETIKVLQAADPEIAQQFVQTHLPQLNPGMARIAFAFLTALRGRGAAFEWIGTETIKALENAGRPDLVKHLSEDFEQLARAVQQPGNGDWRTFIFPLYTGQEIRQVKFYTRRHKKRDKDGREQDAGSRFVVELNLDHTGSMQFDGLVQNKRFDLIMRSERVLSTDWRADINLIFADAMAITGMTGTIAFQAGSRGTVQPSEELRRSPLASTPVSHLSNIIA